MTSLWRTHSQTLLSLASRQIAGFHADLDLEFSQFQWSNERSRCFGSHFSMSWLICRPYFSLVLSQWHQIETTNINSLCPHFFFMQRPLWMSGVQRPLTFFECLIITAWHIIIVIKVWMERYKHIKYLWIWVLGLLLNFPLRLPCAKLDLPADRKNKLYTLLFSTFIWASHLPDPLIYTYRIFYQLNVYIMTY